MTPEPDLDSLTATRAYDRRDFVRTAVGSGFAAAVLPLRAEAIRTDSQGLDVGEVTIPSAGFRLPAYRAMPEGQVNLPVVLVVSEVFGVHEYIADVARRFAKLGYLAIAPELFVRQGDAQGYGELARLLSEVVSQVPDEQVMGDLDACVEWAGANGGDVRRLGITGFCWGGRIVWLYDAHTADGKRTPVKAGVAWYGRLAGTTTALQPANPLERAARLSGPVLGLYGGADAGIPLESIERMKQALAAGGPPSRASQFVVYPDTPHAFHADYRPSYRAAAAEDGWRRCLAWFRQHGVA